MKSFQQIVGDKRYYLREATPEVIASYGNYDKHAHEVDILHHPLATKVHQVDAHVAVTVERGELYATFNKLRGVANLPSPLKLLSHTCGYVFVDGYGKGHTDHTPSTGHQQ